MKTTIDLKDVIIDKIRFKYECPPENSSIAAKSKPGDIVIIDSIFPTHFCNTFKKSEYISNIYSPNSARGSLQAISTFVADSLYTPKIHISDLCEILGITKQDITVLLQKVKDKQFNITLLGYGGTGFNWNYWMSELSLWTNIPHIFEYVTVYEYDTLDITNILRIPENLNTQTQTSTYKNTLVSNKVAFFTKLNRISQPFDESSLKKKTYKNNIFYGAPDIKTRQILSEKKNAVFISATHKDDECELYLNPPQDSEVQIESYGKIKLDVFFMNHLRMTIAFLETLLSEEINDTNSKSLFSYDFANDYRERISKDDYLSKYKFYNIPKEIS